MARTEEELEAAVVDAVRNRKCISDPETLEFMSKLDLAGGGMPVSCGTCSRLFRRDEPHHQLWITAPYDSWGVAVCAKCHERYGDTVDIGKLEEGRCGRS